MPTGKSNHLFLLIKSLTKSEKRYFKLNALGVAPGLDKKYLALFEAIENQNTFDEDLLLAQNKNFKPDQWANLKASLYKKVLQSLRSYKVSTNIDIQLRELIDFAVILFNRSLYAQCEKVLSKANKLASKCENLELQLEILKWKKNILSQTAGRENQLRADKIIAQVRQVNQMINNVNHFTNLSLKLKALYLKIGFIRNRADFKRVTALMRENIPQFDLSDLSLSEKLALYRLYVEYYSFLQDFEESHAYAQKWVAVLETSKEMITSKLEVYISGLNHLLIAKFRLGLLREFDETKRKLRSLSNLPALELSPNIRLKLFKYTYVHEFNGFFMAGEFEKGVNLLAKIKPRLEFYIQQLDEHSRIIMYYKIACLYFGTDNYHEVVLWLNRIINLENADLREDIQGFARIINLICHYEMGNRDVMEYYIRATYRFLSKKKDLNKYQRIILGFLKNASREFDQQMLISRFVHLREQLLPLVGDPYERAFIYFDIISWLNSKIEDRPIGDIVKEKALQKDGLESA